VAAPIPDECEAQAPGFDATSIADALAGSTIEQICLVGGGLDNRGRFRQLLKTESGAKLDLEVVQGDLERLFAQVYVSDAVVLAQPLPRFPGQVRLYYQLKEYDRLGELVVEGANPVNAGRLERAIDLGLPLNPMVLNAISRQVLDAYSAVGLTHTKVQLRQEPLTPGKVRLRIAVDEGPQVVVRAIRFEGANQVPPADLLGAISNRAGGPYKKDQLSSDALAAIDVYFNRGFIEASVKAPDEPAELAGDPPSVELVFRVGEGQPHRVGKVGLKGVPVALVLLKSLETKPGAVYSRAALFRDFEKLKAAARLKGVDVEVNADTEVHKGPKPTLDVDFRLVAVSPAEAK
jgi:outer membrane protein assembly factor BamA